MLRVFVSTALFLLFLILLTFRVISWEVRVVRDKYNLAHVLLNTMSENKRQIIQKLLHNSFLYPAFSTFLHVRTPLQLSKIWLHITRAWFSPPPCELEKLETINQHLIVPPTVQRAQNTQICQQKNLNKTCDPAGDWFASSHRQNKSRERKNITKHENSKGVCSSNYSLCRYKLSNQG